MCLLKLLNLVSESGPGPFQSKVGSGVFPVEKIGTSRFLRLAKVPGKRGELVWHGWWGGERVWCGKMMSCKVVMFMHVQVEVEL